MAFSLNGCVNRFRQICSDWSNIPHPVSSGAWPQTQAIQFQILLS